MQAIIYDISPFDASVGTIIKFSWNGNQFFKNRCVIRENESNTIVYDNTIETFKQEHNIDLAKATLQNGKKYNAYITVFDKENQESDLQSIGKSFLCLKTPVFTFSNIQHGGKIESSSFKFELKYSQENGELLDAWNIAVYTREHTLLSSSGVQYSSSNLSYNFSGFTNKNEYAIRAVGRTVNGMSLDTGYVHVSVTYELRGVFSMLELTNMPKIGAVQVRSNISAAEGELEKPPGIYIDNEELDLKDNVLIYDNGFMFSGNFSLVTMFRSPAINKPLIQIYGSKQEGFSAEIAMRKGKLGTTQVAACFELKIISYGVTSVFYSNKIQVPVDTDKLGVCVSRSDGLFHIEAINLTHGGEIS